MRVVIWAGEEPAGSHRRQARTGTAFRKDGQGIVMDRIGLYRGCLPGLAAGSAGGDPVAACDRRA